MGRMEAATQPTELADYERRFRDAGLPLFIEDRSAREDIFNRAAPLLGIVFIGEMLGAGQLDWPWWQNLLAVAGGLGVLLVGFGLLNLARGRSFRAIPDRLGYTELAAFVLLPATLPLIFGGQAGSAVATIAANLGILLLVYAVVGLGLVSLLGWVLGRLVEQLASALSLAAKAVPLLTIFVLLTFVTQESWLILTRENLAVYAVTIGLFFVLGSGFLVVRVPREARRLEDEAGEGTPPLKRPQLFNVGLVMFVSQGVQVIIVSLVIAAFMVAFGLLTVDASIQAEWTGQPVNELFSFRLFGERLELTEEMLRVAGGLAAFSGFYFAVAMLTDSTYREEFLTELTDEMRQSFRARAEYLRLRAVTG
jgi:small neutral amino acid transporter SnatA (MarC family)